MIGSGPNGLRAALYLSEQGYKVEVYEKHSDLGGGARSAELTIPGLVHDVCSSVHPFGPVAFRNLTPSSPTDQIVWLNPPIQAAHPLGGEHGIALFNSMDETVGQFVFDRDQRVWEGLFRSVIQNFDSFSGILLNFDQFHSKKFFKFFPFMVASTTPASIFLRLFKGADVRSLIAGLFAHSFQPFHHLASSAVGLSLGAAAQASGWPVVEGGTGKITELLVGKLEERNVAFHTDVKVTGLEDIAPADIVMLDTSPLEATRILDHRISRRILTSLKRFKRAPGVFVGHFAIKRGIPWIYEPARHAGTVHLGGRFDNIATSEAFVNRGKLPERPFGLVSQQFVVDCSRYVDDVVPVDAYLHVPNGFNEDLSDLVISSIEEYAPGFRDRIIVSSFETPEYLESMNPNLLGGDIIGGKNSFSQMLARPRLATNPYSLDSHNSFICSASTFPGAGAHGMCGLNAARSVSISG